MPPRKRRAAAEAAEADEPETINERLPAKRTKSSKSTFTIEFCKSCVFRTRASLVQKALEAAGHEVLLNKEKPRRGAFVIKKEGAPAPLVELLSMPRPFKALRELDLDRTIEEMLAAK